MKFREGDFIEDTNGFLFDVKGLIHPPNKVIAFVRYVPDPRGDRERRGVKYTKIYELSKRYDFLLRNRPQYIVYNDVFDAYLTEVPLRNVVNHFTPCQKTNQLLHKSNLDTVEHQTLNFIQILHQTSNISQKYIGVSGSLLVGLHTKKSDVDLLVYGKNNGLILRDTLKQLLHKEVVRPYSLCELKDRYHVRQKSTPVSFQDYVYHESRKSFQGFFQRRDFFIRYVKNW
ncbi:MAG: nucleotidyltransferase domain-containing protein, partial [Candidatus Ranarchaeia archaeon]